MRLKSLLPVASASLLVACVLTLMHPAVSRAESYTTIGKCRFDGPQPSSIMGIGAMTVYHNGTLRITGSEGATDIYTVDGGDVWVIYSSHEEKTRYKFRGGAVQYCDENIWR